MAEAIIGVRTIPKPQFACFSSPRPSKLDPTPSSLSLPISSKSKRGCLVRANAFPDWPLMAVLVERMEGEFDLVTTKSIVHLSDAAIKNVYVFYIMFTVWGCMFFGSTKDPFYDSELYRGDGGDGSGHCFYEKQEDIEEAARAALWREELIEEIEQKVGEARDLEEVGKK
uniref:Photosynthetic NDH subcomplex B 4 n=1 Tax=Monsonia marlothii TaxID=163685 RepID=A0A0F7CYS3_9ROSI